MGMLQRSCSDGSGRGAVGCLPPLEPALSSGGRGRVYALVEVLTNAGVHYWLDGGWGVDALLGMQTRPHSDLDLVIHRDDLDAAHAILTRRGYEVIRDWLPNSIALRDRYGREVDFHPVDPTPDGGGDQVTLDGSRWHYSAPALGSVADLEVPCCSPSDQVLTHLGYEPRGSDFADMRHLAERFHLTLPEPYA